MSMITATTWVPRGYAAPFPTKYVFDEEEYARISKLAKLELDDAKEDLDEARAEATGTGDQGVSVGIKSGKADKTTADDDEDVWVSYQYSRLHECLF